MLQNAYFLAKIGADTAENERNVAEILPKIGHYPTAPLRLCRLLPAREVTEELLAALARDAGGVGAAELWTRPYDERSNANMLPSLFL